MTANEPEMAIPVCLVLVGIINLPLLLLSAMRLLAGPENEPGRTAVSFTIGEHPSTGVHILDLSRQDNEPVAECLDLWTFDRQVVGFLLNSIPNILHLGLYSVSFSADNSAVAILGMCLGFSQAVDTSIKVLLLIFALAGLPKFTWGCLARTCRNSQSVKDFLDAYAKAASAAATAVNRVLPQEGTSPAGSSRSLARSRPGLHIYAALLAATTFNWNAKIIILRSMLGPRQAPSQPDSTASSTASLKRPPQPTFPDAICPNRRVVANLELEIARYRALVARGVVPKDNSSVAACNETGGVIIPPYSLRAFKRFIPVYKSWAHASTPETASE
ncbi:unnamed protein product [Schistocephalus solidus]|uniref:Uncharacterized protein n=1 Tax=Schistocephalus solidus TaxID=70667 RepID=A0A183TEH2_SCHSO|nr:unnamed protein product [Schistocephalus solidus]